MSEGKEQIAREIRGVLIPLQDRQLLLPNAAVAEVIDYRQPEAVAEGPDWLLGSTNWRQRNLMVVRLETLLGTSYDEPTVRLRIVVCHALSDDAKRPFVGIVASAIPRLVRIREELIEASESTLVSGMPIHTEVLIDGQVAIIPDLSALEKMLAEAA